MKKLWVALVLISSLAALWYFFHAAKSLWDYSRLDSMATAEITEWKVSQRSSDQFAIEAHFFFSALGQQHHGKTIFSKPYFLNAPSAERAIKELQGKTWVAWYNGCKPSVCSLQKNFPFLACIQAFLTAVVTLYFAFLRGFALRLAL